MSRPFRVRAFAVVVAIAAAGCQDYNFNPVGHCLIQPGTQSTPLTSVSSADVLFVIDDSGSMKTEQQRLAAAFGDFVENLTSTNAALAASHNTPIDFHVAVTTSSIFYNRQPISPQTCTSTWNGSAGRLACATGTTPVYGPRACKTLGATTGECPVATTACNDFCDGLKGSLYCCAANGSFPAAALNSIGGALVTCSVEGEPCGKLQTHYSFNGQCAAADQGIALDEFPYADGAFVGSTSVAAVRANPRVLHFDRRLYQSADKRNAQGFTRADLELFFKQNVQVGICGSPQEQGLEAARRAFARALAGDQWDTFTYDRNAGFDPASSVTTNTAQYRRFSVVNGVPRLTERAAWPNPASKLVVVYVGDEDDCSSPADPAGGVMMSNTDIAGQDACTRDGTPGIPAKRFTVQAFVDALTGLGRPVGAAFIVSARESGNDSYCLNDSCYSDYCCDRGCTGSTSCSTDVCGGQAPGSRFIEAAKQLKAKDVRDVVVGSVCGDFKPLLRDVADIVKPPKTLSLPSVPAEGAIAVLRIASTATGVTRKICGRPLVPRQPTNYTVGEAEDTGADWWFTATGKNEPPFDPTGVASVAVPSKFIYINSQKGGCIANPGETYTMDYIGLLPPGGCLRDRDGAGTDPLGGGDCQKALGGKVTDWECYIPTGLTTGTCTCRSGG